MLLSSSPARSRAAPSLLSVLSCVGCLLVAVCSAALAQSAPPPYVLSGPLLPLILQAPENGWLRVNANRFQDVWTPDDLEPFMGPLNRSPSRMIAAWSGFGWDSNRGDLILYGGGHANYGGNDVYRWHSSTLQWERASLPSDIYNDPVSGYQAIDGVDHAPSSAHTYDNNTFLPIADRFITFGGAAYNNGGPYLRVDENNAAATRMVGPYLWDPSKADGNKVGGTTGSHVQRVAPHPEIVGGNMWQNRDWTKNLAGQTLPGLFREGCTGTTAEGGRDVVYVGAYNAGSTQLNLYRYQLTAIGSPAQDLVTKVGAYNNASGGQVTCGYDPVRKLFVRSGTNTSPFAFWDLNTPGPANLEKAVQVESTIASLQAWLAAQGFDLRNCALEFDPVRGAFPLWCGGGVIWQLREPPTNMTAGWTVVKQPAPQTTTPTTAVQSLGVLGKWRYAPYYDVFVGLENEFDGNIWIYKPIGWQQPNVPGNTLPVVGILSPAAGTSLAPGSTVNLTAAASDPGGSVARVEYYVNGVKMGQSAAAPYTVPIAPVLVGSYTVIAVAVDNQGGMGKSAPVTFTVNATLSTTVLQRGSNGYAGAIDTFLDNSARTAVRGAASSLMLDRANYTPLVRFAIFQSEGGPVPDGSVFQSATLSLYKQLYDETLQANALLLPWTESEATWNNRTATAPWTLGGAAAAGSDYTATPDDVVAAPYSSGFVDFDVTARVQAWAAGPAANHGWRISQITTGSNQKLFNSSEYAASPTLRPRLTLVWSASAGGTNVPPTVSITTPANGASIGLGASFTLTASAQDSDGNVTKVDYFANGAPIGTATSSPYTVSWTPSAAGSYSLTARATDNRGGTGNSQPVAVTVTSGSGGGTTVVLQRGLSGYAGATDTYLSSFATDSARGATNPLLLDATHYNPLLRFAIFQSEGGPVPNGSSIVSATLGVYKGLYNDTLRLNALLKSWSESQATWTLRQAGVPWTAAGAAGAGSDYASAADALVNAPFAAGWVSFDVTPRVQQWSGNAAANFGWRMSQTTNGYNPKQFNAAEYATDPTLRPKLTVVYSSGNPPPSVSITSPATNATIALGASFALTANASDNGAVTKVEYFANGTSVGSSTLAPYAVSWKPASAGSYSLTAVATDNLSATTTSLAVPVKVSVSTDTTVVLQRGLSGYAGATDTYLDNFARTSMRGSTDPLLVDLNNYNPLLRFAIFQSEGGPVPNGSTIVSATLGVYKGLYNDTLRLNALLKSWSETQATWTVRQTGVPWTVGGAAGAGSDYASTADALVSAPFAAGWVSFDVTPRVQQWSGNAAANFGWRMSQTTNGYNPKQIKSGVYATDPSLRPQLTVVYH